MPLDLINLKSYLINNGFADKEATEIASYFSIKKFEKDQHFVKEGKVSTEIGFLESGAFQFYTFNKGGEELTNYIALPNSFVTSLLAYITEQPARESIKAISKARLWVIAKKDVISLQGEISSFKDFYIRLIEYQLCCIDKAKFDLIALSAEQRYDQIMEQEPEILQKVPLKYIASMLGITPRHLSRLRSKVK